MKAILFFGALVVIAATASSDDCGQYMTCTACVSHNLCGWCSEDVVFPGNITGPQCAGFNENGSKPFACNGIYSTDQCVSGYVCDPENFTCVTAEPGDGVPLPMCEQNCTNQGQVYLCNLTSHTCHQVPRDQPNNGSYASCMAGCTHPSSHPSSSSPSPAATTYVCNTTTGTCDKSTPGHGSSKQVCEQQCTKTNGTQYMCNTFLQQCVKLPPGIHGETLAQCEQQCNPKPNPGPPPMFLGGMWRGIEIQNGYKIGEWDMNFTETTATIVDVAGATTIVGIPYNQIINSNVIFVINITKGPGAGQTMKGIGSLANRGPETNYLTAAFAAPGADAPSSIDTAMTTGSDKVFFLAQCAGTPECVFTMPSTVRRQRPQAIKIEKPKPIINAAVDPCSQYSENCSYCLSHQFCGWCSTDVIYKDGTPGTQCAGFDNKANSSDAFVCNGRYSTFNCTQGYDCQQSNDTCVPDPTPGNGMPLEICKELCRPTPPPTPKFPEYICNITDKKCYKCNQTFCPGAMPESTCAAACVKPKPGPTGLVKGLWRGLQIQNSYPLNEFEYFFNQSTLTVYQMGKQLFEATVESYGGDVMIYSVTSGQGSGSKFSAIYSIQNQGGPIYSIMTLAIGAANGDIPQSFATPMETNGMVELVLAKCVSSPCTFVQP
jgi:hypothetical protein